MALRCFTSFVWLRLAAWAMIVPSVAAIRASCLPTRPSRLAARADSHQRFVERQHLELQRVRQWGRVSR